MCKNVVSAYSSAKTIKIKRVFFRVMITNVLTSFFMKHSKLAASLYSGVRVRVITIQRLVISPLMVARWIVHERAYSGITWMMHQLRPVLNVPARSVCIIVASYVYIQPNVTTSAWVICAGCCLRNSFKLPFLLVILTIGFPYAHFLFSVQLLGASVNIWGSLLLRDSTTKPKITENSSRGLFWPQMRF